MLNNLLTSVFGSRNERLLKQLSGTVKKINALEPQMQALSDDALRAKTEDFKARSAKGESLDKLLPEAFAVCREASVRVFGMRHFDVQLIGGMVLHSGKIAEMRTGEGKTLTATLAVYLNALEGKGVHVVTVNDYLARRDAAQMGKLYNWLGLSVGVVYPGMPHSDKHAAYASDITYATNNEIGFDYLRDNMALAKEDRFQRGLNYAIIDEVDSILIDEARTPLIISGPAEESPELYVRVNQIVPSMIRQEKEDGPGDFWVDEKGKQVHMSEEGQEHAEALLRSAGILDSEESLYAPQNIHIVHHLNAAMRAHAIYQRDVDYIVRDGEVVIVDEFTGRTLPGRRWSDGLHQAVEAKEGVPVQRENQTLASITFQNLFRMYGKLAGMTGTADTEAFEFQSIYGLEVLVIPTNKPTVCKDYPDQVFLNRKGKFNAVLADIEECAKRGQPVLVGTTSIETSEMLSEHLRKAGVKHEVLNAKQHDREATIVANAGRPGAVTIATNMAGRGTDIVLGGNIAPQIEEIRNDPALSDEEKEKRIEALRAEWQKAHDAVIAAGGLRIIGTERHESRRIDNQLRGRAGRQGDPGSSRFYLSLEDPLLRIFAGDRLNAIMVRLKMPEGEAIEHPMVTRSLESAQRRVEQHNFDIRKQLLEYDDVANEQRKVIYAQRNEVVDAEDVSELVADMRAGTLTDIFRTYVPADSVEEQWDLAGLEQTLAGEFNLSLPLRQWLEAEPDLSDEQLLERVLEAAEASYRAKASLVDPQAWKQFERSILLQSIDTHWREHLSALDHLRQGIHLRGYAQKNPKQEYKREAFELFEAMLDAIRRDVSRILLSVQVRTEAAVEEVVERPPEVQQVQYHHAEPGAEEGGETAVKARPQTNALPKVGRNDPCPCGSGKKYKHCHGKLS